LLKDTISKSIPESGGRVKTRMTYFGEDF